MLNIILIAFSYIISFYLIIILHELGHFLFANLVNFEVSEIIIGNGKELYQKKIGKLNLKLFTGFGGFTLIKKPKLCTNYFRLRYFLFIAGGIIIQLIFLLLLFIGFNISFSSLFEYDFISILLTTNILLIIFNLIPFPINMISIDGAEMFKVIFNKHKDILLEYHHDEKLIKIAHLIDNRKYKEACILCEEEIRNNDYSFHLYYLYSICLLGTLKINKAEEIIKYILKKKTDKKYNFSLFNNLACLYLLYESKDQLKKALDYSKKAMKIKSNNVKVQSTYGAALIENNYIDQGIYILKCALKNKDLLKNEYFFNYIYLAYAYIMKNDFEKGIKYLEHVRNNLNELSLYDKHVYDLLNEKID